jgi:hypothetical protein
MLVKSLLKVTLMSVMLVTASVGFTQNSDNKCEVEYLTDDFGDKTGKCRLVQYGLDEDFLEYSIGIVELERFGLTFGFRYKYKDEIKDCDAYLSFKTENNKIIEAKKGFYSSNNKVAIFEMSNEITTLFKNSSKLKMALRLSGYAPLVIEVDCIGFTKAFNEMINCK